MISVSIYAIIPSLGGAPELLSKAVVAVAQDIKAAAASY